MGKKARLTEELRKQGKGWETQRATIFKLKVSSGITRKNSEKAEK